MTTKPGMNRQPALVSWLAIGLVSYAASASAQVTDSHTDHLQHATVAVPEDSPAETEQLTDLTDMNMRMVSESSATSTRSPHAYSGGYTLQQGLYVLPVDERNSLLDENSFYRLLVNRIENLDQDTPSDPTRYDVQAWFGKTYNRFVLKAEGEYADGSLEDSRVEFLWSRATSKFWDTQLGMRFDSGTGPARSWLAAGVQGLAPYWIEVHATAFIGENGRSAISFEAEYEGRLTQRLSLKPRVDVNIYGKNDPERGVGRGLSNAILGLRFQYQFTRQIVPYIGVEAIRSFGETADMLRAAHDDESDTRWIAGLRFWF